MREPEAGPDIDFAEVLRRANARCTSRPVCLECVGEATAELMLEAELGTAWRQILETLPLEEAVEI
jgi:hypothetical protein